MSVINLKSGSSPQVRGKLALYLAPLSDFRLIPAGAGKTRSAMAKCIADTAHPRRCGENANGGILVQSWDGSSPQVRGKRNELTETSNLARLIPAGAGKTKSPSGATAPTAAHPRRCGENSIAVLAFSSATGSSPQVRGKPYGGVPLWLAIRLIPAGAGKTAKHRPVRPIRSAHPRRCGENP